MLMGCSRFTCDVLRFETAAPACESRSSPPRTGYAYLTRLHNKIHCSDFIMSSIMLKGGSEINLSDAGNNLSGVFGRGLWGFSVCFFLHNS